MIFKLHIPLIQTFHILFVFFPHRPTNSLLLPFSSFFLSVRTSTNIHLSSVCHIAATTLVLDASRTKHYLRTSFAFHHTWENVVEPFDPCRWCLFRHLFSCASIVFYVGKRWDLSFCPFLCHFRRKYAALSRFWWVTSSRVKINPKPIFKKWIKVARSVWPIQNQALVWKDPSLKAHLETN